MTRNFWQWTAVLLCVVVLGVGIGRAIPQGYVLRFSDAFPMQDPSAAHQAALAVLPDSVPEAPTVSANDCFRPVSRYFDRITRPEQIITALPHAMTVLTDPAACGPVTLALCQDTQAEAYDTKLERMRGDERCPRYGRHARFRPGRDGAE